MLNYFDVTFWQLGLELAIDSSDEELSIKDIPDIEVWDWSLNKTGALIELAV